MIEEPVFAEPWQAQAFALAVSLHERGLLDWPEFSAALGAEIAAAPDADYYVCWLAALERLVTERALTDADALAGYRAAWVRAAERTPHGTPIELVPADFTS